MTAEQFRLRAAALLDRELAHPMLAGLSTDLSTEDRHVIESVKTLVLAEVTAEQLATAAARVSE